MTKKLEQAARQALEALEVSTDWDVGARGKQLQSMKAITALREALAEQAVEPEQEPVHESLQIAAVALQDIACSSQTNNLLWWQIRAREAQKQIAERLTNSAPAEPVKQEPVAWVTAKESFCGFPKLVFSETQKDGYKPLYAAPVRTKDLTDKELEDAFKELGGKWNGDMWTIEDADLHPCLRKLISNGYGK